MHVIETVVTLHGLSALMQHQMSEDHIEKALIRGERPPADKTSPLRDMAKKGLYRAGEEHKAWLEGQGLQVGQIGLPPTVLFAELREAGRGVKIGRGAISSAEATKLPGFMRIVDPWIVLLDGDGKPVTDASWRVSVMRGQMGAQKTTVGIVRPAFDEWMLKVKVQWRCYDGFVEGNAFDLFRIAGSRVGLCAFRPERNGPFGCSEIQNWESKQIPVGASFQFKPLEIDPMLASQDPDGDQPELVDEGNNGHGKKDPEAPIQA